MIIKVCPTNLAKAIEYYIEGNIGEGIVAGGFIRAYFAGESPSDIDIYFKSENDLASFASTISNNGWKKTFETDRALTYNKDRKTIQLIRFIFGTPEEILKEFDFTVCCAAVHNNFLFLDDDFFEHLAGRILVFRGSKLPLASLHRAFKYQKRGYHICDANIIALVREISEKVNFEDSESLEFHTKPLDPNGERRIRVID